MKRTTRGFGIVLSEPLAESPPIRHLAEDVCTIHHNTKIRLVLNYSNSHNDV